MQVNLHESWRIGDVEIPTRLVLAPMAGVSVQAFRRQGRRYGAGLVCSEMVSCAGLHHGNERTLGYLRIATDEHPLAVQIFGSDPAVMEEAARMVGRRGRRHRRHQLRLPRPQGDEDRRGRDAARRSPTARAAIVEAVAKAVDLPVSVKMRRGLEDGSRACLDVGPRLVEAGAALADAASALGEADVHGHGGPLAHRGARRPRRRPGDRLRRRHVARARAGVSRRRARAP